ncbi:uncharacterized protein EMH_0086390 [Eimeria mitis]|uniref:Uncharacterized protein n=1 Tax=Eimeria mitis TaxID=44415 RepID=U6K7J5_9EIME|nr:uncharacterized protein EMH_0086390 [Eimeria mitis]CDJ33914.1 hypothetical protein EMH_0086390 [Eimeria mitis]
MIKLFQRLCDLEQGLILRAMWQQKSFADTHRRDVEFRPGDKVWISSSSLPSLNRPYHREDRDTQGKFGDSYEVNCIMDKLDDVRPYNICSNGAASLKTAQSGDHLSTFTAAQHYSAHAGVVTLGRSGACAPPRLPPCMRRLDRGAFAALAPPLPSPHRLEALRS